MISKDTTRLVMREIESLTFDLYYLKNPELTICLQQAHAIVCLVNVAVLNFQGRGVIAILGILVTEML